VGFEQGQSVLVIGASGASLRAALLTPFIGQRLRPLTAADRRGDLLFLKGLIEAGELRPVIDATYPLNEAAKALTDADEGHGRGKKVITV
jgi:NADPH:quinone reductase-like Zn-dependent oxidoreductase